MITRQITIETPHLASGTEVAQYYGVHSMILTRWVDRGCPILRKRPHIYDLDQVEQWRREQGMEPVGGHDD